MNLGKMCCRVSFLLLFVSVLFICNPARAMKGSTGILEGRVVDKTTQQAIPAVTITLTGTRYGGITDPEGYYYMTNVQAGTYDVQFRILGYRMLVVRGVKILPDLRTRIDLELEPSAIELEAIEVKAERPLIQKDMPATVYSISEIKLNKLPVSTFEDILPLQPGTTLEGNVRGGKINEVAYFVDGLPVQDLIGGGLGTNLPLSSINGMSIHTGGFEAEYGNAMSGVVNVITRAGGNEHRFGFRLERDSWLGESVVKAQDRMTELELSGGGPILADQLYYFLANTILFTDTRWWQDFRRFDISPVSRDFSGFGKLEFFPSQSVKLGLQGLYSLRQWHDYEFSWRFNLSGLPKRNRDSYRVALMLSHTLSPSSFYTLTLSRFFLKTKIGEGSGPPVDLEPYQYDFYLRYIISGNRNWWAETEQTVYTLKGDFTSRLGRSHLLKVGGELNQYDLNSTVVKLEPQTTYFGKPLTELPMLNYGNQYSYFPRSGGVYIQDKIEVERDGSILTVGLRWDFLDPTAERPIVEFVPTRPGEFEQVVTGATRAKFKHQISPRLAIAVPIGTSSFYFLNFGRYFQYPLFDYLYSGINRSQLRSGSRSVLVGNPDLEPERSIAWETGIKHGFSEQVVGSVTYFKKTMTNQIDSKTLIPFDSKFAGDFGFAEYVNNSQATATGVEFLLSREGGEHFSGSISYSYMIAEGVSEYVNQSINLAQWGFPLIAKPFPLSWDQRHTVKVDADFQLPGEIQTNLVVLFNSPRPYTFFPTRDGFTPLNPAGAFVPNNSRMENVLFVNAKLSKVVKIGNADQMRLTFFSDIRNLFNKQNIKWIDSSGRVGGELSDPSAYYDPRRVRVGVRLDF